MSRNFSLNQLYLMLHVCDRRFDVTENLENFYQLNKPKQALGEGTVAVAASRDFPVPPSLSSRLSCVYLFIYLFFHFLSVPY